MDLSTIVYTACLIVAGGMLLVSVLVDDILGNLIDVDIGGVGLFPLLFGFVAMFGVGGLVGQLTFGMTGREAAIVAVAFGVIGTAAVFVTWRGLRLNEAPAPPTLADLVGQQATVSVGIEPGRTGTVLVSFAGAPQSVGAVANEAIGPGTVVVVTGVAGTSVVVAPARERQPVDAGSGGD